MNPEFEPMDPALERAVSEIREESPGDAVVEAAAARVWAKLSAEAGAATEHIRGCADFQALIPAYRAGTLDEAKKLLLQDHLHQCVACRRVWEGRVVEFPAQRVARPVPQWMRWAAAAALVVAGAGVATWYALERMPGPRVRASIQAVNGTLYLVSDAGLRPLAAGQNLPYGVELRTAKDSGAMLALADGSLVELRERSDFQASESGADTTIRVGRGSVIVQAAKRRSGHLYVATADCRVAVTGTVFSVEAGTKGSRVSVLQGQVRVAQNSTETVLAPGQQAVTTATVLLGPVADDFAWSHNRDRLLRSFPTGAQAVPVNRLLKRLPAGTAFFATIPNAAGYLAQAKSMIRQKVDENPELRAHAGRGQEIEPLLEKLSGASEFLGGQVVLAAMPDAAGKVSAPVFLAEMRRPGLAEYLKNAGVPVTVETRDGVAVFGPEASAVAGFARAMDAGGAGFESSPCYAAAAESQSDGGGLVLCADMGRLNGKTAGGPSYFMAEQKLVNGKGEARLTLGFGGPRTGMASWLAAPAPMRSLDFVSPEATFAGAFVVKSPAAIVDEIMALREGSAEAATRAFDSARQGMGFDPRTDLAASLGGEFALALDGAAIPVPSWKLVTEVYDPARLQATLRRIVEAYNRQSATKGGRRLTASEETVSGRTYYTIAVVDGGPLLEAHYTFSDGYLVAAPSRALVGKALQTRSAGVGIARSAKFQEMAPRDHYANFSAVIYQNLGTTLAPLAGLLGGLAGNRPDAKGAVEALGNMKPMFIAAYGEQDRITFATQGDALGAGASSLSGGNLSGLAGGFGGSRFGGTRGR